MKYPKCPTCKGAVVRATAGKAYPFCSERCQLVDLGRWLGEEYRIPDHEAQVDVATDEGGQPKRS